MKEMTIRLARLDDAARLLEIYAPYVTETAISFETVVPSVEEFRARMVDTMARYPYLVAEKEGKLLGYAYTHAFVGRACYDWAAETTIYVAKDARRGGVGRALYEALERASRAMGILNLEACIGVPDGAADEYLSANSAEFHAHIGYRLVGEFKRCGYKFGRWYNMIWMEKHLGEHPTQPRPVRPFTDFSQSELAALFIEG